MNRLATLLLTVAALSIALPGGMARHCGGIQTSEPDWKHNEFYFVIDRCFDRDCIPVLWVYEEANGMGGLQRGDPNDDDTCHGRIASDRIVA